MHKQFFFFSWPQCAGAHFPTRSPFAELSFNAVPVLGSDHLIFMGRAGRCFRAWIYIFHSRCDLVFLLVYNTYMYNRIYTVLDIFWTNSVLDFFPKKSSHHMIAFFSPKKFSHHMIASILSEIQRRFYLHFL